MYILSPKKSFEFYSNFTKKNEINSEQIFHVSEELRRTGKKLEKEEVLWLEAEHQLSEYVRLDVSDA